MQVGLFDDGRVGVTGVFSAALNLGFGSLTPAAGNQDLFVAVLDEDGAPMWAKQYGGAASHTIASSSSPPLLAAPLRIFGLAIGAKFNGTINLGGGAQTAHIDGAGFILDVAP